MCLQVQEVGCEVAVVFEQGFEVLLVGCMGGVVAGEGGDEGGVLEDSL